MLAFTYSCSYVLYWVKLSWIFYKSFFNDIKGLTFGNTAAYISSDGVCMFYYSNNIMKLFWKALLVNYQSADRLFQETGLWWHQLADLLPWTATVLYFQCGEERDREGASRHVLRILERLPAQAQGAARWVTYFIVNLIIISFIIINVKCSENKFIRTIHDWHVSNFEKRGGTNMFGFYLFPLKEYQNKVT